MTIPMVGHTNRNIKVLKDLEDVLTHKVRQGGFVKMQCKKIIEDYSIIILVPQQ